MEKNEVKEKKKSFAWSFNPVVITTSFTVGIPLNFEKNNCNIPYRFFAIVIGSLILLSNFIINGPRIINKKHFDWMDEILSTDTSPYVFFEAHPEMLLQLVVDVTAILFYITLHLIPLAFLVTFVATSKWIRLVSALEDIQNEMNLSNIFHKKCRRTCIFGLLLLALV